MIAITLNKEIDGNWLLQQIHNEINKCGTGEDRVLYIEIKNIEQTTNNLISKLEYKEQPHGEVSEPTQNNS
jgi:hypothetical protein